jgi:hypothetical protein
VLTTVCWVVLLSFRVELGLNDDVVKDERLDISDQSVFILAATNILSLDNQKDPAVPEMGTDFLDLHFLKCAETIFDLSNRQSFED